MTILADVEARAFSVAFCGWLSEGDRIYANPVRYMQGRVGTVVLDGFELLGSVGMSEGNEEVVDQGSMKSMSAKNLVYCII